jgi:hypothetical protein
MSAGNPLSRTDMAAIDAIVASNRATNEALVELARAMKGQRGASRGRPDAQPEKPRQSRSYRLSNVTRGADGEVAADVEYSDGRVRRFRVARDEIGDLVGELDDGPPSNDGSTPSVAPEPGAFADIFGSLEGT